MTVRVRVIPCLDVADGRVVKGVKFVNLRDAGDPVEAARAYDAAGVPATPELVPTGPVRILDYVESARLGSWSGIGERDRRR